MAFRRSRSCAFAAVALSALAACHSSGSSGSQGSSRLGTVTASPTVTTTATPPGSVTSVPTPALTPTPTPTPSPTVVIHPSISRHPTIGPTLRILGDLRIGLVRNSCTFYTDTSGGLWIAPELDTTWTGPGPFPTNLGFSMTTNYGKATAGGPVHNAAPFRWAIGGEPIGGNSWLGHTVVITVTIDPGNDVAESNESNNVTTISLPVDTAPSLSPTGSDGDHTTPCGSP